MTTLKVYDFRADLFEVTLTMSMLGSDAFNLTFYANTGEKQWDDFKFTYDNYNDDEKTEKVCKFVVEMLEYLLERENDGKSKVGIYAKIREHEYFEVQPTALVVDAIAQDLKEVFGANLNIFRIVYNLPIDWNLE